MATVDDLTRAGYKVSAAKDADGKTLYAVVGLGVAVSFYASDTGHGDSLINPARINAAVAELSVP